MGGLPLGIDEQPGSKAKRLVEPRYDLSGLGQQLQGRRRRVLQAPACLNTTQPAGCSAAGRRHMGPSGTCYDRPLDAMMAGAPVSVPAFSSGCARLRGGA
jgi:hypothetical protein